MEIGKALKAKREDLGLTIRRLSALSGVSAGGISRIERGKRGLSVLVWEKLAIPLGLNMVIQDRDRDKTFEELKLHYNLPSRSVEGIRTVATTQEDKPLQVFDNPNPSRDYHIVIPFPEFTSLCPKTGQPDFATVTVDYIPDKDCVELKSWKLYLNSYRNEGHFIEELANLILNDLFAVLSPRWIMVEVLFNTRGGMAPVVRVEWKKID